MAKMKRRASREQRVSRRDRRIQANQTHYDPFVEEMERRESENYVKHKKVAPLEAQTEAQAHYMIGIESATIVFGVGPAGTGKTYVCAAMAAEKLESGEVQKIILTRPAVDAGESLGFLPGELDEKYEPYLQPFRDVFHERLGRSKYEYLLKSKAIEPATLAHMRGRTFKNAFIILDEAQNLTPAQMKMFLTRIGTGCTVVVNGDPRQKDIHGESGLTDALQRLSGVPGIKFAHFEREDIVRSGIVQHIVERYED